MLCCDRIVLHLQARRLRKALEHAIRSTVIQSRAARYRTEIDTSAPKQAATAVRSFKRNKRQIHTCAGHELTSYGAKHQVLLSPGKQQLPNAAADLKQSSFRLLSTVGPESTHVAWSDHAELADSARAFGTAEGAPTALTLPEIQKEASHVISVAPELSDAHDNVLFEEGGWSEQGNGDDSNKTIHDFQRQIENGLQSMQLELQKFKSDVLTQLNAVQTANAGKHGTRARSRKGSTQS